jgi:hypothetical protein
MSNFYNDIVALIVNDFEIKTPTKFCHLLHINPSNIGAWKRGVKPSIEILNKILAAFPNLSADWLITGKGAMYKNECPKFANIDEWITYLKDEWIKKGN